VGQVAGWIDDMKVGGRNVLDQELAHIGNDVVVAAPDDFGGNFDQINLGADILSEYLFQNRSLVGVSLGIVSGGGQS